MKITPLPDLHILQKHYWYDPETGFLHNLRLNRVVGYELGGGYVGVRLNGYSFLVHRLAWKLQTGSDPVAQIDHIDGIRTNNRWNNLREATSAENKLNNHTIRSSTGYKNVYRHSNGFRAIIELHGVPIRSKTFKTIEDAHKAAVQLRELHHGEFANHGAKESTNVKIFT